MLSHNLRTFTGYGLVERAVEATTPPKVTYSLTPRGVEVAELLQGLLDWVGKRTAEIITDAEGRNWASARSWVPVRFPEI